MPAATATTLFATATGKLVLLVVPLPNWPLKLAPMAQSVPSAFTNSEKPTPAAPATTLLATVTGTLVSPIVPLPNWPYVLSPQSRSVALEVLRLAGKLIAIPCVFVIITA